MGPDSKRFFKCPHCREIATANEWDQSTLADCMDEDEDTFSMTSILDAMEHLDGGTWFSCPHCLEQSYNDSLEIREVPLVKTRYAETYYATNQIASELLEESW